MEKTLKFNLDESYAQGYNDARKEIAEAIEAQKFFAIQDAVHKQDYVDWVQQQCAKIARGVE